MPSVPQPSAGQSDECNGCQRPYPVIESEAQVIPSMSHWPQQQLTTNGDKVPPLVELYLQSWDPAGAAQSWFGVGGTEGQPDKQGSC
jgi:hypothetical protein